MPSSMPGIRARKAGHAVADVVFGDYNPSGKLPVTFPRNVGQVPIHYDMKNTGRPIELGAPGAKYVSRYLNTPNDPLYRFGYGLSYTSFGYSPAVLSAASMGPGGLDHRERYRDQHRRPRGRRSRPNLYVRDLVGSVTQPVQELKGF